LIAIISDNWKPLTPLLLYSVPYSLGESNPRCSSAVLKKRRCFVLIAICSKHSIAHFIRWLGNQVISNTLFNKSKINKCFSVINSLNNNKNITISNSYKIHYKIFLNTWNQPTSSLFNFHHLLHPQILNNVPLISLNLRMTNHQNPKTVPSTTKSFTTKRE
jgi:hypothetical protein